MWHSKMLQELSFFFPMCSRFVGGCVWAMSGKGARFTWAEVKKGAGSMAQGG